MGVVGEGGEAFWADDGGGEGTRRSARGCVTRLGGLVGIVFVMVVGYFGVTSLQVYSAASDTTDTRTEAIIVLGAAQYNGTPSPALKGRLDHALELYERGIAPRVVLTGASKEGEKYTEAYAGLTYLREAGIPEEDLLVVTTGTDTYESLAAARRVLRPLGVDRVVLVSDPSHNLRLRGIADELRFDAEVSATEAPVTWSGLFRETAAVGTGRVVGYRRMSSWASS